MKNPKKYISSLALFLGLTAPLFLAYQAFFSSSPLVWGDAPYFYAENMAELFSKPLVWNTRNDNFGDNQSLVLWLFIPTFLYGLLNQLVTLSNDLLIRIIFYFPAVLLAVSGSYIFLKRHIENQWALLLGSLLYSLNSYFLLLIDGGQIGVALAYGLFPWVIYSVGRFLEHRSLGSYILALFFSWLITNVDLRLALIAAALVILLRMFKTGFWTIRTIQNFIALLIPLLLLNSFWLLPMLLQNGKLTQASLLNFPSPTLIDALLVFQPHFPLNHFGFTVLPPFYYAFMPLLLIGGVIVQRKFNPYLLLFLLFVFIAKGDNPPFGDIYNILKDLPGGFAFRDSAKFYLPLLLLASLLLALTVDNLIKKTPKYGLLIVLSIYLYLLLLVHPALGNGLTGVLSKQLVSRDEYHVVYHQLEPASRTRSLWFPEKLPLAFSSWQTPAISANTLYQHRPFASMIDGTFDLYGYLNSPQVLSWIRLLNIGQVFFPEDSRKKILTADDRSDRQKFVAFVGNIFISEQRIPLSYPAFKVDQIAPRLFTVAKSYFVLGGDEIYQQLFTNNPDFKLEDQGFIFLEDPRLNLTDLSNIRSEDANTLISGDKGIDDLAMLYTKNWLLSANDIVSSNWGQQSGDNYLQWKAELLKAGVRTYDYAIDQVYYSSVQSEKITFQTEALSSGQYYLGLRTVASSDSADLRVQFADKELLVDAKNNSQFTWQLFGPYQFDSGIKLVTITNQGGFQAISGIAVVPAEHLNQARVEAEKLLQRFSPVVNVSDSAGYEAVRYHLFNPAEYRIKRPFSHPWLIFSDRFDQQWQINNQPGYNYPMYGMINGIYLTGTTEDELDLRYSGQDIADLGVKISLASAGVLLGILLVLRLKKR